MVDCLSSDCTTVNEEENFVSSNDSVNSPILDIPEEMFLYICSFLDIRDVVCSLSIVCKKFYSMLQNENMYKSWISAKWGRPYAMVSTVEEDDINWKGACVLLEKEWKMWSGKLNHKVIWDAHISNADAVLLLKGSNHCVTASRDHFMALWDLSENCENPKVVQKVEAHNGWVWRVRQVGDCIYSASWDQKIKGWLWKEGLKEQSVMKCSASVLCLTDDCHGLIYGGTFARSVQAFDFRTQSEPLFSYESHRGAVLTLDSIDENIISGSEDRKLAVYDSRMRKLRCQVVYDQSSYPISCEVLDKVMYLGDNTGTVRAWSLKSNNPQLDATFQLGYSKIVSTVKVTRGAIITGSADGCVRSHLTLRPPYLIGTVKISGGQTSGMDYCDGKLVIGTASTVEFWTSDYSH